MKNLIGLILSFSFCLLAVANSEEQKVDHTKKEPVPLPTPVERMTGGPHEEPKPPGDTMIPIDLERAPPGVQLLRKISPNSRRYKKDHYSPKSMREYDIRQWQLQQKARQNKSNTAK